MALFTTLPILSFFLGMQYQQTKSPSPYPITVTPSTTPTSAPFHSNFIITDADGKPDWNTYTNYTFSFRISYPKDPFKMYYVFDDSKNYIDVAFVPKDPNGDALTGLPDTSLEVLVQQSGTN